MLLHLPHSWLQSMSLNPRIRVGSSKYTKKKHQNADVCHVQLMPCMWNLICFPLFFSHLFGAADSPQSKCTAPASPPLMRHVKVFQWIAQSKFHFPIGKNIGLPFSPWAD